VTKHNQRAEYGKTLLELGRENQNVVVLEADLGKSTMTHAFGQEFPERYFQMGIAEANMTGFAAGLALAGKVPFTNSFAVFAAGRSYDQIRQSIGTAELPVKIVGSSAGLSDYGDGATHQSIDDLALMCAIPGMVVLTPCDGLEAAAAARAAAKIDGPVYLRLSRNDLPDLYPDPENYDPYHPAVLKDGEDVLLVTCGIMAGAALEAAESLAAEGISAAVAHLPAIKPFPAEEICALAEGKKAVVFCEEHSVFGGLGSIGAVALAQVPVKVGFVAVKDSFGQSASSHEELLRFYHLDADNICAEVRSLL